MSASISLRRNGTTVRPTVPGIALLRAYFRIASRLMPGIARRQAERLFTRPPRYAGRRRNPVDARHETVEADGRKIAVWQAGRPGAPAVLLAHGWGGRGVQLGSFVVPLLERGYRVVWFDQPGHGESGRGPVGLPDLVRAAQALGYVYGPFEAAIGHSLGAAALGLALRQGLPLTRIVFVSSPASMTEHTRNFARFLGIAPRVREAMRRRLERRYGVRFADIDRIDDLARLTIPALFIHDVDDAEVPFEHALRLSARMPGAKLVRTWGLGHHRLLREPAVVQTVANFVAGRGDLPDDLPELPRPAPIY
jgi:pimeloyl-ACP methyl ester carboxylesterase